MEPNLRLHGLLNLIEGWDRFNGMRERLRRREVVRIALPEGAKPFMIAAFQRWLGTPILVVTPRPTRARELQEQIAAWSSEPERVLLFPEPDSMPYDRMPPDPIASAARLAAMVALVAKGGETTVREDKGKGRVGEAHYEQAASHEVQEVRSQHLQLGAQHSALGESHVVVACARAMMEPLMSPGDLIDSVMQLQVGQHIHLQATLKRWVKIGYMPTPIVEVPGTFSRRGGILDIFPLGSTIPYRIELFGEEIESIRSFDPATQRSEQTVQRVDITPPHEVLPFTDSTLISRLQGLDFGNCTQSTREIMAKEIDSLVRGEAPAGLDFYRAFLGSSTLLDYLPAGGLLVLDDPAQISAVSADLLDQSAHLQLQAVERGEIPKGLPPALREWESPNDAARLRGWSLVEMGYNPEAEVLPFNAPPSYGGKVRMVLDEVLALASPDAGTRRRGGSERGYTQQPALGNRHAKTVVLVSRQSQRLAELLAELDYHIAPIDGIDQQPGSGLYVVHGSLRHGWSSDELAVLVMGDTEIFGWTKAYRGPRQRTSPRESFISDLAEGDLVVHIEHGIGRFTGMEKMSDDGHEREYLVLQYAEGDKLYVPADQMDRITRYVGAGESTPALSRLGTSDWMRAKERVKNSVRNVAKELLQIYSARQAQPGFAFSPDTPWQGELETSFPYVETPDQLQSIREVIADMELDRPMDRLICGDVGYGKTEVALRAAFKAVMDGKQVAVLVPTTVLAQQHYNTFRERLQSFPINLEVLSRFRSEREQRRIVEGLRSGWVDICIGTHRLIQKDVEFKDLGLVVVDEEQRFGVMHKEKLKQLRRQVDVLTLSATPIPRTLHMALAGIRDMSTMETPPEDRLPIRTFVTEYSDNLVREAILREMDRGGQVYFVHNRIQNIHFIAAHLQKLVPAARIVVGHGQMPEETLERVMMEFADGKHDVLVCTTIIESGLDMPNVNTIIVNRADHFGLAQLYQLRGRVGRGANRAYAYFLYDRNKQLNETAEKRLKTIFENSELGSGFRIAMKDLEIRGAGNLLGVEQHGHVNAVGFDLYTRLLAEAVGELQGKPQQPEMDVSLDLPLAAYLPEDYVADSAVRLNLYQRLATIKAEEGVGALMEELQDRFGPMPIEAQNLFYLLNLKLLAKGIGVSSITNVGGEIVLKLDGIPLAVRGRLQRRYRSRIKVLPNQIRIDRGAGEGWVPLLQGILYELRSEAESPSKIQ